MNTPPTRRRVPAAHPGARGPREAAPRPSGTRDRSRDASRTGGAPGPRPTPAPARRDFAPVLFLSCAAGVEAFLAEESRDILSASHGLQAARYEVEAVRAGVTVRPTQSSRIPADLPFDIESDIATHLIEAVFALNLHSRLAQRVLWRVALGPGSSEDQLYLLARSIPWQDWITPRNTLRVDITARLSPLQSLNFATLRIKDAVCDHFRESDGERPSVDTWHPDLGLCLHLDGEAAHLYVDTSGEALFKRGWREDKGEAPLKETLAAAMLAAAGWKARPGDGALLDPCCGSGTIAIEAAQIACGIAAGLQRRFAFERLGPFQRHLVRWQEIWEHARDHVHAPTARIHAGDVSFRMTDFATRNAERAGVLHAIEFKTADALQRLKPEDIGLLMFNPPYGERIDAKGTGSSGQGQGDARERIAREDFQERDANDFFTRLASHWKKHYTGWTAWVLSPDMKLPSAMRLKESRRIVMFNGPIECRLFRFDMQAGSMRKVDQPAAGEEGPDPSRA